MSIKLDFEKIGIVAWCEREDVELIIRRVKDCGGLKYIVEFNDDDIKSREEDEHDFRNFAMAIELKNAIDCFCDDSSGVKAMIKWSKIEHLPEFFNDYPCSEVKPD